MIKKLLTKLRNKKTRALRKFAAWLLIRTAKPGMEKLGQKEIRWMAQASGMWLLYYVSTEFPLIDSSRFPLADNSVRIKSSSDPHSDEKKESSESFRQSDFGEAQETHSRKHPSQA